MTEFCVLQNYAHIIGQDFFLWGKSSLMLESLVQIMTIKGFGKYYTHRKDWSQEEKNKTTYNPPGKDQWIWRRTRAKHINRYKRENVVESQDRQLSEGTRHIEDSFLRDMIFPTQLNHLSKCWTVSRFMTSRFEKVSVSNKLAYIPNICGANACICI